MIFNERKFSLGDLVTPTNPSNPLYGYTGMIYKYHNGAYEYVVSFEQCQDEIKEKCSSDPLWDCDCLDGEYGRLYNGYELRRVSDSLADVISSGDLGVLGL